MWGNDFSHAPSGCLAKQSERAPDVVCVPRIQPALLGPSAVGPLKFAPEFPGDFLALGKPWASFAVI
jgi:hypothetical protein